MVEVSYHTDPACPWSWALEPSVRKLMVVFEGALRWTFVMGGLGRDLLPEGGSRVVALDPASRSALIEEWLTVAARTGVPLDPMIWAESPLRSTYPACMAVKAAAEQADDRGYRYLRHLREGILCGRRKLDHAEALAEEARAAGLDVERFRLDLRSHAITEAFGADLEATQALVAEAPAVDAEGGGRQSGPEGSSGYSRGAGGAPLPTLVFESPDAPRQAVWGLRPFEAYRDAALAAGAEPSMGRPPGPEELVARYGSVTTAEVEAVCELPGPRAGAELYRLAEQWKLRPVQRMTGIVWEAP
jgi:predicted DsbA family dithiol-disulfide isomerase